MSKIKKISGVAALGLGIVISIPVLAHEAAMAMDGPGDNMHHSATMPRAMMHSETNVEQHLGKLKESLQLTKAQQPAWKRFEQAVKTMAANKPLEHNQEHHMPDSGMDAHFARMEKNMSEMKSVVEARKALFETLTEEQKQSMENFMPGPFGPHG